MQPVPLTDEDAWRREQILNEKCFGKFSEENPDMSDEKYLPREPATLALKIDRRAA